MEEKDQHQTDQHLNAPSESNQEKHINFRKVEEESSGNFMIDKTSTERQKKWKQDIEEGKQEREQSNSSSSNEENADE